MRSKQHLAARLCIKYSKHALSSVHDADVQQLCLIRAATVGYSNWCLWLVNEISHPVPQSHNVYNKAVIA